MTMIYFDRSREGIATALPGCEVFYVDGQQAHYNAKVSTSPDACMCVEEGWYWWPCFPGCLPDGEPNGPFKTEADAVADARSNSDDDDASG